MDLVDIEQCLQITLTAMGEFATKRSTSQLATAIDWVFGEPYAQNTPIAS